MNRKQFLKQTGYFSAGAMISPMLFHSIRENGQFTLLRNDIGYFTGQGGTIGWYVHDDALVAIDSQFPDSAVEFIEGIEDYGGGPEQLLFNTHHHADHTAGNPSFLDRGFQIFAHHNVPDLQQASAEEEGEEAAQVYADNTYGDLVVMDIGNEQIMATHYGPAHTAGDSVIWFRNSNIVHVGDLVFNRLYPFIDTDGGASIRGWISTLETIVDESDSDTLFIFGHGHEDFGVTGARAELELMRDYLEKLLDYTQQGIQDGKSREEITEVEQFDDFPNHRSPIPRLSLPANLQAAYDELSED